MDGFSEEECNKEFENKLRLNETSPGDIEKLLLYAEDKTTDYEKLTSIDLSNSSLSELPSFLGRLVSLQILIADQNCIDILPSSVGQLVQLRRLSATHNKLSDLPSSMSSLHMLEVLDLSYNEFASPPLALQAGCAEITQLNMSHNFLSEWNVKPLCVLALRQLDLSYNYIQSNPEWIWGDLCQSLEILNLGNNNFINTTSLIQLNQLWKTGVYESLLSLDLSNCGVSSNDLVLIHQCRALESLHLGNSKEVKSELKGIRKVSTKYFRNVFSHLNFKPFQSKFTLKELILSSLNLPLLPDDICCLESLEVFDCSSNELQWLPDGFFKLLNLRIAVFSFNQLSYLPEDISMLKSLEELWLDFNQIEDLPVSLGDLRNLQWLDLYSNLLEGLPTGVQKLLPKLSGLDLGYNFFSFDNEQEANGNTLYEHIKTAMREYPQLRVDRKLTRTDELKTRTDDRTFSSPSSDESDEDRKSSSSINCEVPDPLVIRDDSRNSDDEVWDLEDDENDHFDPTCLQPRSVAVPLSSGNQLTSYSFVTDAFCPADSHATPSVKPVKSPYQHNDGQFDDA